jgi:hypothetical protein
MSDGEAMDSQTETTAKLLEFGTGRASLWAPDELGAILQHQLAAPLEPDLSVVDPSFAERWPALSTVADQRIQTFRDLFQHACPPVELLELAKRFAKHCRTQTEPVLPEEIATVLYFAAIATALVRTGHRISGLNDQALWSGLNWALQQPWLDATLREILNVALRFVPTET